MIPINEITTPVVTNYNNNVECLIYIKYKWGQENCIPDNFIIVLQIMKIGNNLNLSWI